MKFDNLPVAYLRDQCRCSKCFSKKTQERIHNLKSFNSTLKIKELKHHKKGISITWNDGHVSEYNDEEINEIKNCFSSKTLEPLLWEPNFNIPCHNYENLDMKNFLSDFLIYGISKVSNTPIRNKFVEYFANSISCVREIVFDRRVADIIVKKEAYTQGFTPVELPLHTDVSGYRWPPSVFLFHCLENTVNGGENTYSDGFKAIQDLKNSNNHSFDFLKENDVGHRLFSNNHDTKTIAKVFEINDNGLPSIIRYANWALNPIKHHSSYIDKFYTAISDLSLHIDNNKIETKLKEGELLIVNNQRVLHGRKIFDHLSGNRHFQQVYMEIDDIEAKWRRLN